MDDHKFIKTFKEGQVVKLRRRKDLCCAFPTEATYPGHPIVPFGIVEEMLEFFGSYVTIRAIRNSYTGIPYVTLKESGYHYYVQLIERGINI